MTSRSLSWRVTPLWIAFSALVALNLVWLVVAGVSTHDTAAEVEVYAACRMAIRRARAEAARAVFPTLDLIRASRRDSARYVVRGFFGGRAEPAPTWYTCSATRLAGQWTAEKIVFDNRR